MSSEYDFLFPYSRGLRRAARILAVAGAIVAGMVAVALVVAIPLQPRGDARTTIAPSESAPVAAASQDPTTIANPVSASIANPVSPVPTFIEETPLPRSVPSDEPPKAAPPRAMLGEPAPEPLSPSPAARDVAPSPARLPAAAAAQPPDGRVRANPSSSGKAAGAPKRTPDRGPPEQQRVRPEPFSIEEFLASRR
jgi:hypothetical protein